MELIGFFLVAIPLVALFLHGWTVAGSTLKDRREKKDIGRDHRRELATLVQSGMMSYGDAVEASALIGTSPRFDLDMRLEKPHAFSRAKLDEWDRALHASMLRDGHRYHGPDAPNAMTYVSANLIDVESVERVVREMNASIADLATVIDMARNDIQRRFDSEMEHQKRFTEVGMYTASRYRADEIAKLANALHRIDQTKEFFDLSEVMPSVEVAIPAITKVRRIETDKEYDFGREDNEKRT